MRRLLLPKALLLLLALSLVSCLRGTNAKITLVIDAGTLGLVGGQVGSVKAIFENETESFGEAIISNNGALFDAAELAGAQELRKSAVVAFKATPSDLVRVRAIGYASADGTGVPLVAARGLMFLIQNDNGDNNLITLTFDVACGNGSIEDGEECDDGNTENGDGCDCQIQFNCGNGTVDAGEECDDANNVNGDGCSAVCQNEECGDGAVNNNNTEQCDDGNQSQNDACLNNCQNAVCGDGQIFSQGGNEQCDDGNTAANDGCDAACQLESVCGDGIIEGVEVCDDGDAVAGDGCSNNCTVENGFSCTGQPSVCVLLCGNGALDAGEECDGALLGGQDCTTQGFDTGTLACNANCTFNTAGCADFVCGNNTQEGGEVCDGTDLNAQDCVTQGFDAGTLACNGTCDAFVTTGCTETCGDNAAANGEVCDGADLLGEDCVSQGFTSGTLACAATCDAFDTAGCI